MPAGASATSGSASRSANGSASTGATLTGSDPSTAPPPAHAPASANGRASPRSARSASSGDIVDSRRTRTGRTRQLGHKRGRACDKPHMDRFDRLPDAELLRLTATAPEAFGAFYRRHVQAVLAYSRRRTGSAEIALDLTAEVFA